MIPFDEISNRLEALGKDRRWLAQKSGRSYDSIRTALAPKAGESKRSELLLRALSNAIEAEERQQVADSASPLRTTFERQQLVLRPTDDEYHAWCQAAIRDRSVVLHWAVSTLNRIARERLHPTILLPAPALEPEPTAPVTHLPFYGLVAAGTPAGALDDMLDESIAVPGAWPVADHFALRVSGQSMEPDYPDGATLICRRLKSGEFAKKGQDVISSDSSGAYFKRLVYLKDGAAGESPRKPSPRLVSINPAFPGVVPVADCPVIAVVVGKAYLD